MSEGNDYLPKILLVDDKPENILSLRTVLRPLNATIFESTNGNDALKLSLHHDFALMLLDVRMPEMDGYELAAFLRQEERSKKTPIIFVTAEYPSRENLLGGYQEGAIDYLTKPIVPEILLSKARVLLELDSYRHESIRSTEEKYSRIFQAINEAIFLVDDTPGYQGLILEINHQAEILSGLQPNELLGKPIQELFSDSEDFFDQIMCSPLGSSSQGEFDFVHPRRDSFPVNVRGQTFQWPRESRLLVIRDISLAKKAETIILKQKESAESANKAKDLFLANMSHELRTPLNGIYGMAQLLLQANLSPEQESNLEMLIQCAESLKSLIDDLLNFSFLEVSPPPISQSPFDLVEVLEGSMEILRFKALEKRLELIFRTEPEDLGFLRMYGDQYKVAQIIQNLISNGIKYTEEGEIQVVLQKEKKGDQSVALITVSDTGIGIAKADMERIFEKFVQLEDTYTKTHGGVGLGLSIARKLVDLMKGSLEVESTLGQGTQFTLKLPLGEGAAPAQKSEPKGMSLEGRKVLLAEDEAINALFLQKMLRGEGMEVQVAKNGAVALEIIEKGYDPEIVLMDISMPRMDGLEATRVLRAAGSNVKIVALTAHAFAQDIDNCQKAGMSGFIAKPVKKNQLLQVIRAQLGILKP